VGNAVVRNRVKRWIKEVARHWLPAAPRDIDVVVVARSEAGNLAPARARTEIDGLLRRLDSAR
jgi:ribonuclease P protein component